MTHDEAIKTVLDRWPPDGPTPRAVSAAAHIDTLVALGVLKVEAPPMLDYLFDIPLPTVLDALRAEGYAVYPPVR